MSLAKVVWDKAIDLGLATGPLTGIGLAVLASERPTPHGLDASLMEEAATSLLGEGWLIAEINPRRLDRRQLQLLAALREDWPSSARILAERDAVEAWVIAGNAAAAAAFAAAGITGPSMRELEIARTAWTARYPRPAAAQGGYSPFVVWVGTERTYREGRGRLLALSASPVRQREQPIYLDDTTTIYVTPLGERSGQVVTRALDAQAQREEAKRAESAAVDGARRAAWDARSEAARAAMANWLERAETEEAP